MIRSLRSLVAPAFAILALGVASSVQAAFTVTFTTPTIDTTRTTATGGTTLSFSAASTQTAPTNGQNPITVLNIGEPTGVAGSTGMYYVNYGFTITGDAGQQEVVSATSVFTINGTVANYLSTTFNATSGNGLFVLDPSTFSYSRPGIGSTPASASGGSLGFLISANAVPEPASVVMLGLGLVGTVGFAARRRSA